MSFQSDPRYRTSKAYYVDREPLSRAPASSVIYDDYRPERQRARSVYREPVRYAERSPIRFQEPEIRREVYRVPDDFDVRDLERQFRRSSVADAAFQVAAPVRRVVDHRRDYLDLEDYHTAKDKELIISRRDYDRQDDYRREYDDRREYEEREVYDSRDYDRVQDYLHGDRRPVENQELVIRREKDYTDHHRDRYYEADVRRSTGSFGRYYDERDREERIYEERIYEEPPRREVEREREIITTVLEAQPRPEPKREVEREREIITTVLAPLPAPVPEPKRYEHYHHHRSHHRSKSRKRSSSKSKEKELKKELKREKKLNKKLRKELEESSSSESEEEERVGRATVIEGEGLTIVRRRHHSRKGEVTETFI